jgi:hypothetical protein
VDCGGWAHVGDAAHATNPSTGQGASLAISVFRDLTLPLFLRLGAKAAVEQYGYRV